VRTRNPSEYIRPDSTHYNPWVQKQGLDPEEIFKILYECKLWQNPNARHMKYRGTSLPRTKFFLVDSENEPPRTVLPRYSYPDMVYNLHRSNYAGFQWESMKYYHSVRAIPAVKQLMDALNREFGTSFNHVIGTFYRDHDDNIGYHTDKIKDISDGTLIAIVSFGETRTLTLKQIGTEETEEVPLQSGDLFMLGWGTNQQYQHALLEHPTERGSRISLVFRDIKTRLSWGEISKKIQKSCEKREDQ
jgi:alkylated DNA repair dioxygenase AlkB